MLPSSILDHPPISPEERTLRSQAIAQARASVRLEGIVLPVEIDVLNGQYIDGKWSTSGHVEKVMQAADALAKASGRRILNPR